MAEPKPRTAGRLSLRDILESHCVNHRGRRLGPSPGGRNLLVKGVNNLALRQSPGLISPSPRNRGRAAGEQSSRNFGAASPMPERTDHTVSRSLLNHQVACRILLQMPRAGSNSPPAILPAHSGSFAVAICGCWGAQCLHRYLPRWCRLSRGTLAALDPVPSLGRTKHTVESCPSFPPNLGWYSRCAFPIHEMSQQQPDFTPSTAPRKPALFNWPP